MVDRIDNYSVKRETTVLQSLKKMDEMYTKTLFVFDKDSFLGIITIGDIQRSIIAGISLDKPVSSILDSNKIYASLKDKEEDIKALMMKIRAETMPVLDECGKLVRVYFWDDFFSGDNIADRREKIDFPVVIMAGGKGTRLKPLTNVIPKPLIPVGDKTILEEIMDQFVSIGCKKFYMSVNYKYDFMEYYLGQLEKPYDIEFFMEDKPLGTIGSVALLKGKITTPFFVSNCDIRIDQDFRDVYEYHRDNKNDITIVTALKSFKIPYGVIETGAEGLMTGLVEKPEMSYMINTGVYLLNPELIDEIPAGEFFHITHLMEKVKARGGRVGCFPIGDGSWRDMGEWPEYLKMIGIR